MFCKPATSLKEVLSSAGTKSSVQSGSTSHSPAQLLSLSAHQRAGCCLLTLSKVQGRSPACHGTSARDALHAEARSKKRHVADFIRRREHNRAQAKQRRRNHPMPPYNQNSLVAHLKALGCVQSRGTDEVMRKVDRIHFVQHLQNQPGGAKAFAYKDEPLPIGLGQTISAPSMHAICLDLLAQHLQPGSRVLDVGSGSGYLTACMALLVGPQGRVTGVEKFQPLAERSIINIHSACPELQVNGEGSYVQIFHDNIFKEGSVSSDEMFDAIHVGAAATEVPQVLLDHLKPCGRLVIPVGRQSETQKLMVLDKLPDGEVHSSEVLHVRYVPLTKPEEEAHPTPPNLSPAGG